MYYPGPRFELGLAYDNYLFIFDAKNEEVVADPSLIFYS